MSSLTFHSNVHHVRRRKTTRDGIFGSLGQGDSKSAILEALKAGYRLMVLMIRCMRTKIKSGAAIRELGLVFEASKIASKHRGHGYHDDNVTVTKGVDESLAKFGFGKRLESYKALLDAKKAAKVKSVGVSNYGVKHLEEIKRTGYPRPVVNQIELHPL